MRRLLLFLIFAFFTFAFPLFTFALTFASQNALVVPDGTGAQVRAGFNNAIDTLNTIESGPSAPTTTEPYMLWADTTNNLLEQMNSSNTAWVVVGTLGAAYLGLQPALPIGPATDYLGGDLALHPLFPGAGVPLSTGSAWGTSYTVGTGANDLVQLNGSGQLPAVSGALLTNLPIGSMVYPGAGVPNSTGSAWGTSYTVGTGPNDLVQLNSSGQLPAVSGALLTGLPSGGGFSTQNVVTSSRTLGTVYQNTTGKTIWVSASSPAYMSGQWTAYSDSSSSPATEVGVSCQGNGNCAVSFMVLNNNYYKITATGGTLGYWIEWY
ncbi:MAG: hypothetical protein WBQ36_11660 [Desulfobaccales bacterium]